LDPECLAFPIESEAAFDRQDRVACGTLSSVFLHLQPERHPGNCHPLQQAQRARQDVACELIGIGDKQHRDQAGQPGGV
jgi:hypothetical protein